MYEICSTQLVKTGTKKEQKQLVTEKRKAHELMTLNEGKVLLENLNQYTLFDTEILQDSELNDPSFFVLSSTPSSSTRTKISVREISVRPDLEFVKVVTPNPNPK